MCQCCVHCEHFSNQSSPPVLFKQGHSPRVILLDCLVVSEVRLESESARDLAKGELMKGETLLLREVCWTARSCWGVEGVLDPLADRCLVTITFGLSVVLFLRFLLVESEDFPPVELADFAGGIVDLGVFGGMIVR